MKVKYSMMILAAIAMSISASGFAGDDNAQSGLETTAIGGENVAQFLLEQAERQQRLNYLLAPIKSRADLVKHLSNTAGDTSPLDYLTPGAKGRFIASLKFNENGLVSLYYEDIEAELTATQAYELLSLFGVQRVVSMLDGLKVSTEADRLLMISPNMLPDHDNYECIKRATCGRNSSTICMSGC